MKEKLLQLKIRINGKRLVVWLPRDDVKPGDKVTDLTICYPRKNDPCLTDAFPYLAGWEKKL